MLNQATIDNILNLNTYRRRPIKTVYDVAERRARLAAQIDRMSRRMGLISPYEINALVRIGTSALENTTAASTYDTARKAALVMLENKPFLLKHQAL